MTLNWINVSNLSFNTLLLLEREQLAWLPGWLPETELGTALHANPAVEWFLRHKNPELDPWVDSVLEKGIPGAAEADVRAAEEAILRSMNDLICYAVDPDIYDKQPFLYWDENELTRLVDFRNKLVADIGAGTGKLTFIAAEQDPRGIFAVEPVGNLRHYLKMKAHRLGYKNVFPISGLIDDLPFPNDFLDVLMGGHVFGNLPEAEYKEMVRVTKPGGIVILCPGNDDNDNETHRFLEEHQFNWSRFEEPQDGLKRKYWKRL